MRRSLQRLSLRLLLTPTAAVDTVLQSSRYIAAARNALTRASALFSTRTQLFTRRAAAAIFSNQRLQRWCFDVELIYVARRLGVPISGAPAAAPAASLLHCVTVRCIAWYCIALYYNQHSHTVGKRASRLPAHATHTSTHNARHAPRAEVQVTWTEMAGSKIRFTSILHMAFELATLKVGIPDLPLEIRQLFAAVAGPSTAHGAGPRYCQGVQDWTCI